MVLGISAYFMSYLLDSILYMLLESPPYQLMVWVLYLSFSQVPQHLTHWLQPT